MRKGTGNGKKAPMASPFRLWAGGAVSSDLESPYRPSTWRDYVFALAVLIGCNALAWVCSSFLELTNILMIYLIGILVVVARAGKGPSTLTCVAGVLSFEFFMVPPRFAVAPTDSQYLITLAVVLIFTLALSEMIVRTRSHAEAIRLKETRTASLFNLSRKLAATQEVEPLLRTAVEHIATIFESRVGILMPDAQGDLALRTGEAPLFEAAPDHHKAAQWVHKMGNMAGPGTGNFTDLEASYLPLMVSGEPVGVLVVQALDPGTSPAPYQQHLLQALANQIGASLQNVHLSAESRQARLQAEAEQLRNALLSSVSHDLRTPLAVITGSASSLLDPEAHLSEAARQELVQDIYGESERLNRLLGNLLEMTRLSGGKVELRKELQPLEEVVGSALARLEKKLTGRRVTVDLPEDLPMLPLDSLLMEQVFINLLENSLKYTPAGSPIHLMAHVRQGSVKVVLADQGPGLVPGEEEKVFEKFFRSKSVPSHNGVGLGLTICRGVVEAHGGRIWAENRPEGGASFCLALPIPRTEAALEKN